MDFEREEYDDLKAYKIMFNVCEDHRKYLKDLENQFIINKETIARISSEINEYTNNNFDHSIFSLSNSNNNNNSIDSLKTELEIYEQKSKSIHEKMKLQREKVAEFSFILNVLKDNNSNSIISKSDSAKLFEDILKKLQFINSIINIDHYRVRQEIQQLEVLIKNIIL